MNMDSTELPEPPELSEKEPLHPVPTVGREESEGVLRLLDDAIVKSRRSRRQIERNLGWSQGYLGSLLRGRIGLKVWHVFALSHELGIEALSLFLTVAPPRDPSWILQQLGITLEPAKVEEPAEPAEPPLTRGDVEVLARKLLYEELTRFGLVEPRPAPGLEPAPAHSK